MSRLALDAVVELVVEAVELAEEEEEEGGASVEESRALGRP